MKTLLLISLFVFFGCESGSGGSGGQSKSAPANDGISDIEDLSDFDGQEDDGDWEDVTDEYIDQFSITTQTTMSNDVPFKRFDGWNRWRATFNFHVASPSFYITYYKDSTLSTQYRVRFYVDFVFKRKTDGDYLEFEILNSESYDSASVPDDCSDGALYDLYYVDEQCDPVPYGQTKHIYKLDTTGTGKLRFNVVDSDLPLDKLYKNN